MIIKDAPHQWAWLDPLVQWMDQVLLLDLTVPSGLAVDSSGNVFVADRLNHTIRKITAAGVVTTLAGQSGVSGSVDGNGSSARFYIPTGLAVDSIGNVYVADTGNHTIRKITAGGAVTTFAGQSGVSGSTDATGSSARFNNPKGVAVDSSGNIYVADYFNHTIRKITPAGLVTTFAGMAGTNGSSDGIGTSARFFYPSGLTVDSGDNVYVADNSNHTIRKITSAGLVTTLAGMAGTSGYIDSGGTGARFNSPTGVTVDGSGNVYVADTMNHTIRTVTPAGVVSTLAGSSVGTSGSADGTGSAARFNSPTGVTVDGNNNIYVADTVNNTIRRITFGGVVTTLAGYSGPAIPAINNQVTFSAGSMTQYIGFVPGKANATVNLTVISGARSISTPMTVSNPLAGGPGVDSNYLYAEPPTLNGKKIVGSHEFPKLVPLKFPSGATLMCSPNGSGFLPENCSGIVDGGLNYIWTASDAINNQERYFQISLPGGGPRTYKFRPSEIYGTTFKAYNCDHVQSTDTGFSQINSLYSGSVNVVCLGQTAQGVGVVVTKANGVDQISLIGDGGRALIGHTGGNTVNAAFLPVGGGNPNIPIGGDISTRGVVLANLNLTGLAGSDPFVGLIGTLVSASPNKQVRISGNTFTLTGVGSMTTYGIRSSLIAEPDIEIHISNNNFTINSPQNPGGTTYGIALTDADFGATWIKDNSFIGGGAAENCQTVGVSIESASRPVNFVTIENMKWQGNGCGIIATGSGGANVVSNLVIKNSNIELNSLPNPSLTALGVKLFNVASFTLSDNRVAWTDLLPSADIQNLVKIDSGGSASTGVFRNNVLATTKNPANNFLMINNSVITLNSFDHNQFVYTGSSSIPTSVISNVSSIGLNRSSLQTHGNNLFCSGSANVWSSILLSPSAGSFNESDANTSCKHANDVDTTTNLCKTPCAP
jgi:sugar lactone lactonase YvrE